MTNKIKLIYYIAFIKLKNMKIIVKTTCIKGGFNNENIEIKKLLISNPKTEYRNDGVCK